MIAYCGLNCSKCEAYLATQENNDEKREKTAHTWSELYRADIKPAQINCTGCTSDGIKFFHCDRCDIRQCCFTKGVGNCAECKDYICDQLAAFIKLAPEAGKALETLRS
jgi:Protein of unknown function (DUF3795)